MRLFTSAVKAYLQTKSPTIPGRVAVSTNDMERAVSGSGLTTITLNFERLAKDAASDSIEARSCFSYRLRASLR
jgi:hypothetical protein